MRKGLCFAICIALLFIVSSASSAKETVRVAWFEQPGYQETADDGWPNGYNYEYLRSVARVTGWKYEYITKNDDGGPLTWRDSFKMLREGRVDIVGCAFTTQARSKEYLMSSLAAGQAFTSLFVRTDSPVDGIDLDSLNGLKVAVMRSTTNDDDFLRFASENGFKPGAIIDCARVCDVTEAVESGKADAGVAGSFQPNGRFRVVASFRPDPFYFAVSRRRPDIWKRLNYAMTSIAVANPYYSQELAVKYGQTYRGDSAFNAEELQWIAKHPVVTVAFSEAWRPILNYDKKKKDAAGIAADIFSLVSKNSGLKFKYNFVESQSLCLRETAEGKHDIAACYPWDIIAADKSGLALTDVYYELQNMLVSSHGEPRVKSETDRIIGIAVNGGLPASMSQNSRIYNSPAACFEALRNDAVDCVLVNSAAAIYYRSMSRYSNFAAVPIPNSTLRICAAVADRSDNKILLSILNKSLGGISREEKNQIAIANMLYASSDWAAFFYRLSRPALFALAAASLALFAFLITALVYCWMSGKRTRRALEENNRILTTDVMTGLLNQNGFELAARRLIEQRPNRRRFMVDFDINSFKHINAKFGFDNGDHLLRTISTTMRSLLRARPSELCSHIHADRFVWLAEAEDADEMRGRVLRLNDALRAASGEMEPLLNYGIYEITDSSIDISAMCDRAQDAKRTIKGHYEKIIGTYDEKMHRRQIDDSDIVSSFDAALAAGEFRACYQPKVYAKTRRTAGAEALVRWRHDGRDIMPDRFIGLFEKSGQIIKLDLFMLDSVCKKIRERLDAGLPVLPVSVNFSRCHLLDDDFVPQIAAAVRRHSVPASFVEIEFTESAFFNNEKLMRETINRLHALGLSVSIDDFGSGFSSLNLLKEMPFDIIKLDRVFLSNEKDQRGDTVVRSVLSLAAELSLVTVAEGVEMEAQYQFLLHNGCDLIQGYYFSRPIEAGEYYARLDAEKSISPDNA